MNERVGWVGGVLLLVVMMVLSSIVLVLSCFCFFFASSDGDEIETQHELVVKCTRNVFFLSGNEVEQS